MSGRYRNTFAEVNLQVLEQNFASLQGLVGTAGLIPMVKADAYGHGDIQVSRVCEKLGAKFLGVALIEEGVKLRLAGIQAPILVFGFFDSVGADAIIKYRLTPVLSNFKQIESLKMSLHDGASYPVHVKFNTGMQRLGFNIEQADEVIEYFKSENYIKLEGVCSHFVSAQTIEEQEALFQKIIQKIKNGLGAHFLTHLSASAGIFTGLKNKYDLVRPGISLYGYGPASVNPILSLKSEVSLLRQVKKDQTVSYSGQWKADRDCIIAVVALGYADGLPRRLSNKGEVLINGVKCPIRGIVCMDYCMVDVTEIAKDVVVGDEVVIIGTQKNEKLDAAQMAEITGTISYEILTGIQNRVPRVYVH